MFRVARIAVFSIAIILTKSRGAWIGLVFSGIFLFLISKPKEKIRLALTGIAAAFIFYLFFLTAIANGGDNNFKEYFTGRFSAQSLQEEPRVSDLDFALNLWERYPIFGVGIGNYNIYAADYYGSQELPVAPDIWAQALAETGIFGFGALFLLMCSFAMMLAKALKRSAAASWHPYLVGYSAGFVALAGQYFFSFDRLPLYFWVFMGIAAAAANLAGKNGMDNH